MTQSAAFRDKDFINSQLQDATADRHAVYKAAHVALQGRVTSVPEACHLVLGQPTVLFSRGNIWIPVAMPGTWDAGVPACDEARVLQAADRGEDFDVQSATLPATLAAYAARPRDGSAAVPVEGQAERTEIDWERLSLFDYVAGVYKRGHNARSPAIVGFKTSHPDRDAEQYYFTKLLMHVPWRSIGDLLQERDEGNYRVAFENLCLECPKEEAMNFLASACFPKMEISAEIEREIAKLNASLLEKRRGLRSASLIKTFLDIPFSGSNPKQPRRGRSRFRAQCMSAVNEGRLQLAIASRRFGGTRRSDRRE